LILCVLSYAFVPGFTILTVWKYFIFCQNFNTPQPAFFSEVWSLSIEEWFYLLIPLLIFTIVGLFKLAPKKALLATIAGVIVCTILYRYYRYLSIEVTSVEIWDTMFRKQVVTRMDSLMFGVAGAWFYYYYPSFWIRYSKPAFITALLLLVVTRIVTVQYLSGSIFYYCNLSFILVSITVLLLLPFLSQLRTGKGPLYRFVTYTSLISYSMYLTHVSLVMFFIINKIGFLHSAQPVRMVIRYILYWGVTYGLSILLYKYFELPFMAMRPRANKEAGSVAGAG